MLKLIKDDLKKNYYDESFRGIDLDKRFAAADEKMKAADSLGQIFGIVAQVLMDFDDSHLYFIPPSRSTRYDYGLEIQMVGDKCLVKAVKPGSDAQVKGLKPGDQILSFGGYPPSREILWKITYAYYSLRPQPMITLSVQSPGGAPHNVAVAAKIKEGKLVLDFTSSSRSDLNDAIRESQADDHINRVRLLDFGKQLVICRMPTFEMSEQAVDDLIGSLRKYDSIILDLRGNGGGSEIAMKRLIGSFFDHEVKIGDLKGRKISKSLTARGQGDRIFSGKLIVLVDSDSASAAEVVARVIQLEKRGTIIGDRTMGAVMRAMWHEHEMGADTKVIFGTSITNSDVIMSDGKSLEKNGVTPDEIALPTQTDLAAQRDPVLAHAASLCGVTIDPAKAGSFFPVEWRKQ
jgi:C-terminal processing protease CtpA/Prc